MRIAFLAARKTALRAATTSAGGSIRVDADAGVIYGAAVMSVGPAQGHGFSVDATTLQQVCDLGNAMPDGVKCHLAHPQQQADGSLEDQVDALIGRIRNFRIDGDVLRGDIYLGSYAADLPGAGDVRSYVLSLAQEDPAACGLSAVLIFDTVPVLDEDGSPEALVARATELIQVDLVGSPAANRRGLLAAVDPPPASSPPSAAAAAKSAMAVFMARARDTVAKLRATVDAWAAQAEADDGAAALQEAFSAATDSAQACIAASRSATDVLNRIQPGTIDDEATLSTGTTVVQTRSIIEDQAFDLQELLFNLRFGSTDLARATAVLCAVLRTLCASTSDLFSAVVPVAALPIFAQNLNAVADGISSIDDSAMTRALAMQAYRSDGAEGVRALAELRRRSPDAVARLRAKKPAAVAAPEPTRITIPTHDDLNRGGGEPGVKLLTWLSSRGLSARHTGECRFEIFGSHAAVQAITYPEESLLKEWAWSMADPLARIEAQRLATLAAGTQDVAERERLAFASLAWHHESPGALAMFTMPDSTVGPHTAQTTRPSPDHAALPPVPDGMAVLVV